MKYILVEITTLKDGVVAPGIIAYDEEQAALSAYYGTLASKMVDSNVKEVIVKLETSKGATLRRESWLEPEEAEIMP